MKFFYFLTVLWLLSLEQSNGAIIVNRVYVRVPKENDIGIIFDVNVVNNLVKTKEMLEFQIRPENSCCLNLTDGEIMTGAGRVVGGNFGSVEAGASKTISLIWPTVSLYNRVGSCPIIITSTNAKSEEVHLGHVLNFDTRFATLDPDGRTLRKHKNFKDCKNWDLDYFKNCTPVDCEVRYFGRRSFYNCSTQRCEGTARCTQPNQLYDMYANECIDLENFVTEEDLEAIRQGKFENNLMDFKCDRLAKTEKVKPHLVVNELKGDSKQNALPAPHTHDDAKVLHTRESLEDTVDYRNPREYSSVLPYWLKGLLDGLFIVVATIAIYVLICFIIFLVVSWISRRNFKHTNNAAYFNAVLQRAASNSTLPITNSSLMSQRR